MKKLLVILFVFCVAFAQDKEINSPRMSLAFDVGNFARTTIFAAEIEYLFHTSLKHQFSMETGIEFYRGYVSPSIGINYSYGQKHQLLTGIRVMATHMYYMGDPFSGYQVEPDISPKFGYRYIFGKESPKAFVQAYVSPHILVHYSLVTDYMGFNLYSGLHLGFGLYL